jgi:serine/threonine protein kinase
MLDIMPTRDTALAATLDSPGAPELAKGSQVDLSLSMRSTVLPRLVRVGDAAPNDASAQRFVPVRVLGRGGLGEVTLVHDHDIDRPVALKRLHGAATSEEMVHRFAQEIRTVGQLEHPNIAPVHDVGVDDHGQHYFVMRYVEGETLEAVIARLANGDPEAHRHFTFERRVEVFLNVLHAIQYAHSRQIVHRDIKPANVMIGPYGEVLMMDWGVAKKRGGADRADADGGDDTSLYRTRSGSLVGTPAYMSPEQAAGRTDQIDERSDVYSLCVLFYELLSLQHYLPGRSSVPEMLAAICNDSHVHASHLPGNPHQTPVPAELGWFIEKGLAKDPADRYQSVTEMIDSLHRVLAGQFAVQCPVTLMKRVGGSGVRLADHHPIVAMLGSVALVLLVAFAMFELVRALT